MTVDGAGCAGCSGCGVRAAGYRGVTGRALCARCFVRQPAVLRRSLLTALVVGSALTAINQGNVLIAVVASGELSAALLWKVPLTYLVPLAVSTWGALGASRIRG